METPYGSEQITQAYLYGFPLVFNLDQVDARTSPKGVGAQPGRAVQLLQPRPRSWRGRRTRS